MDVEMDQTSPPTLLDLPRELLHSIILECHPPDLAAIRGLCHTLKQSIDGDALLFRDIYLKYYDVIHEQPRDRSFVYERALKRYTTLQRVLESSSIQRKIDALPDLGPAVEALLKSSLVTKTPQYGPSRNLNILRAAFKDDKNKAAFLARSSLYARAYSLGRDHYVDTRTSQMSAKLHVLYGAPVDPRPADDRKFRIDMFARSRVYDLRRYTEGSFWGPFLPDGSARVDWEKLQAIMLVIQHNLRQFHDRTSRRFPLLWHTPWAGVSPRSFISPVDWRQRKRERDAQAKEHGHEKDEDTLKREARDAELRSKDPYNVTGTWMRVVCFLDYSDLHAYNFTEPQPADDAPRPPLEKEEAIRLITMKLQVTKVEPAGEDHLPGSLVTHFAGTSRSMHVGWDPNANSGIREWHLKGTVSTTTEGEIRWTSFSVFHGEERWRSEGIQVGGQQSARGVWGSWFDKDYDPEGPAGPTAFWKLTDDLPPTTDSRNGHAFHAHNHSHPVFVSDNHPQHIGQHTLGSAAAVGLFGAAASTDANPDGIDGAGDASGRVTHLMTTPLNGEGAEDDSDSPEEQHPYNQVIVTDGNEDDDEVLLEIEEDENGEGGGTVTVPASEILEILEAGSSSSEDDDDYQPLQQ